MTENKPLDLNQVTQDIANIFQNINKKEFLTKLVNNDDFWSMLTQEQKSKIERLVGLMVDNARVTETRKLQQQFFYPILTTINQGDVKTEFETNNHFQACFLSLAIIFLAGFHAMNHQDAAHHDFIAEGIKKAIQKITG